MLMRYKESNIMYKDKDVYDTFDQLIKLLETMTKRMQETELKLKQLDDKLENEKSYYNN